MIYRYKFLIPMFLFLTNNINIQSQYLTDSSHIAVKYYKGMELFDKGQYEQAIEFFNDVIDRDNGNHAAYFQRSYAYYYLGKYKTALVDIEKAFENERKDHRYFYLKGLYYDKQGNYDLAGYYINMALMFQPDKLYYYSYRAALYLELGKYREAIHDFDILIANNPHDYKSYYGRGLAYNNIRMKTEACLDWLYARDYNENCKRYFFYKCTDLDLRGKSVKPVKYFITEKPQFRWQNDTSLSYFFSENLKYPLKAYINHEEGTVLMKFIVTANKQIKEISILQSPSEILSNASIEAIKASEPYWETPAMNNDNSIDFTYYLPITFKLSYEGYHISEMTDSLRYFYDIKRYDEVYELSNRILLVNHFMAEVLVKHEMAASQFNLPVIYSNFDFLKSFDYIKNEIHDELWINTNFIKIYFNEIWQVTTLENASYVRISNWNSFVEFSEGSYTDFTIDGNIYSEGSYNYKYREGKFSFYYPDGKIKSRFSFKNNLLVDTSRFFYPNGQLKYTFLFDEEQFKILNYFDSTGIDLIPDGNGSWEFSARDYQNKNSIKIKGELKEYKREGTWQFMIGDMISVEENYELGKFVKGYYYEDGYKTKIKSSVLTSWFLIPFSLERSEQMEIDPQIDDPNLYRNLFNL
ncbi:MAG: TonB family protein [Bacteroidales bacterium]|nr:TonB family protein [Bacteroidales bacterium]